MCGIVGYIGPRQAPQVIYDGLKRLEYRGYDLAGIAVLSPNGEVDIRRDVGKLSNLQNRLAELPLNGHIPALGIRAGPRTASLANGMPTPT